MNKQSIVMIGATGAVGNHTALQLSKMPMVRQLTLLGRRPAVNISGSSITQHQIDVFSPQSYESILAGHDTAICTLGVGEPSKVSKDTLIKVDKTAVLDFAQLCKKMGIKHFQLLSSVSSNPTSVSFYLRNKGELEEGLKALKFDRLSIFHPSVITTPHNRYGISQGITLAIMPLFNPILLGAMKKFRSIPVATLGIAIAMNLDTQFTGTQDLHWYDFIKLSQKKNSDLK